MQCFHRYGSTVDAEGNYYNHKWPLGLAEAYGSMRRTPKDWFEANDYDQVGDENYAHAYIYMSKNEEKPRALAWSESEAEGDLNEATDIRTRVRDSWEICNGDLSIIPQNNPMCLCVDNPNYNPVYEQKNKVIWGNDSGSEREAGAAFVNDPEKWYQYVEFTLDKETTVWLGLGKDENSGDGYWHAYANIRLEQYVDDEPETPPIQIDWNEERKYSFYPEDFICEGGVTFDENEYAFLFDGSQEGRICLNIQGKTIDFSEVESIEVKGTFYNTTNRAEGKFGSDALDSNDPIYSLIMDHYAVDGNVLLNEWVEDRYEIRDFKSFASRAENVTDFYFRGRPIYKIVGNEKVLEGYTPGYVYLDEVILKRKLPDPGPNAITTDMWHEWDSWEENANIVASDLDYCGVRLYEKLDGGEPFAGVLNGTVPGNVYADLTQYAGIYIKGTPGTPWRGLFNRQSLQDAGDYTNVVVKLNEEGEAYIYFDQIYDLKASPYIHLNTAKINWGGENCVITQFSFIEDVDNTHLIKMINNAANADRVAVNSLFQEWENTLNELSAKTQLTYTGADGLQEINKLFQELLEDIDSAQAHALEALTPYKSPSVNENLVEIKSLIKEYKKIVEYAIEQVDSWPIDWDEEGKFYLYPKDFVCEGGVRYDENEGSFIFNGREKSKICLNLKGRTIDLSHVESMEVKGTLYDQKTGKEWNFLEASSRDGFNPISSISVTIIEGNEIHELYELIGNWWSVDFEGKKFTPLQERVCALSFNGGIRDTYEGLILHIEKVVLTKRLELIESDWWHEWNGWDQRANIIEDNIEDGGVRLNEELNPGDTFAGLLDGTVVGNVYADLSQYAGIHIYGTPEGYWQGYFNRQSLDETGDVIVIERSLNENGEDILYFNDIPELLRAPYIHLNSAKISGEAHENCVISKFLYIKDKDNEHLLEQIERVSEADRTAVNGLYDHWETIGSEMEEKYPAFALTSDRESIISMFDHLFDDIEEAKTGATQNLRRYASPVVSSTLEEISALIDKYQSDVEEAANKAMAEAQSIAEADLEQLTYLLDYINELEDKYEPINCIEPDKFDGIVDSITMLIDNIMAELEEVYNTGSYHHSNIEGEIADIWNDILRYEDECFNKHWNNVEEASNVDQQKVNALKDEYLTICENLHNDFPDSFNPFMENVITLELDTLLDKINEAANKAKESFQSYMYPFVDPFLEEIRSIIEAYENYVRGSILSDEEIEILIALDREVLILVEDRIIEIEENYLNKDYINMDEYLSTCDELDKLFGLLRQVGEEAYESHKYSTPWTNEDITELYRRIDELEKKLQEAGISGVEADPQETIYYDLNGRRILHPTSGKLYIRIVNGKVQKVIL